MNQRHATEHENSGVAIAVTNTEPVPDRPEDSPVIDGAAIERLIRIIQANGVLQSQVNQAITARLLQVERTATQAYDVLGGSLRTLEQLVRDLNSRVERLTSESAGGNRFPAYLGDGLLLTKVLNRFRMYADATDMSVTPYLVTEGRWEPFMTELFTARLKPGMTVIDVGANIGYYTLLAAAGVGVQGRVHAFEPDVQSFKLLQKNISANWFDEIVRAYPLAAYDSKQHLEFHKLRQFQGSSSLFVPKLVPEADARREDRPMVETVALDDIVSEPVDLMKIDAEGSEPFVLEGMRGIIERSPNLAIFMEFNIPMLRQSMDPWSFLNRIRELGFALRWVTPWDTVEPLDEEKAKEFQLFNLLLEKK